MKETIYEFAMKHTKKEKTKTIKHDLKLAFASRDGKTISTRKVERAIVFVAFFILSIIYMCLKLTELTPLEFIELLAPWLAYGGFNTYQITRERINIPQTQEQEPVEQIQP